MRISATAVERIINEDMAWLTKADSQKLLVSLLVMRRYESDYRLTRDAAWRTPNSSTSSRRSTKRWAPSSPPRS